MKVDDFVVLSKEGEEHFRNNRSHPPGTTGRVVRVYGPDSIKVLRTGLKTSENYAARFWEVSSSLPVTKGEQE